MGSSVDAVVYRHRCLACVVDPRSLMVSDAVRLNVAKVIHGGYYGPTGDPNVRAGARRREFPRWKGGMKRRKKANANLSKLWWGNETGNGLSGAFRSRVIFIELEAAAWG